LLLKRYFKGREKEIRKREKESIYLGEKKRKTYLIDIKEEKKKKEIDPFLACFLTGKQVQFAFYMKVQQYRTGCIKSY